MLFQEKYSFHQRAPFGFSRVSTFKKTFSKPKGAHLWVFRHCATFFHQFVFFRRSPNCIVFTIQFTILQFLSDFKYLLKNVDNLFGSEYKREIYISQAADIILFLARWNERVVIMHSFAEFIEMKRVNVRNYAFVRRVIEIKRTSVNYSLAESFACIQM